MEIEIIKASKPTYWYADKIGKKYRVEIETPYHVTVFRFRQLFNRHEYHVFLGDYKILNSNERKSVRKHEQAKEDFNSFSCTFCGFTANTLNEMTEHKCFWIKSD